MAAVVVIKEETSLLMVSRVELELVWVRTAQESIDRNQPLKFFKYRQYQECCNQNFEKYRQRILKIIPDARVEHVGSSSIEGSISKGDLDIFVGIEKDEFESTINAILDLGFTEKQGTLRTTQLCMLESETDDSIAIQVVVNGSKFEFFLHFKELLISDPVLLSQYNQLKIACTGLDEDEYRRRKSDFIEKALKE